MASQRRAGAIDLAPQGSQRPVLALVLALLAIPGTTLAWDLPLGGLWIGLPLAVAAIVLGLRARSEGSSKGLATAAVVIAGVCILQMAVYSVVSAADGAATKPRCFGMPATIVGTDGDDRLLGTAFRDVIVGLGGADVVYGRGGDDRICGKGGDDQALFGGQGDDRIATGPGNNGVSGDAGDDILQGGSGADDNANYFDSPRPVFASVKRGFARGQGHDTLLHGIDELFGSKHRDTLIGDKRAQLIAGFGGNDTIRGGDGNDQLAGGSGNDRIDGGRGLYDLLADGNFGGPGTAGGTRLNLAKGIERGHGTDTLTGIEGTEGTAADDLLTGGPGPDVLVGQDGDDVISGAGGGDLVEGDAGLDELDGGAGVDYTSSYGSPHAVTIDLGAGTLFGPDPEKDSDTLLNIEDAVGSTFDDTIVGDAGPNVLRGDPGGDSISGGGGDDILLADCSKPKNSEPRHLFYELPFDCSSAKDPDTLDGGADDDKCVDGETVAGCEKTRGSRLNR
jgi:Ca2+-binding RTX toxin-like protein